jgi:hypothetical protein
MNPTDEFEEAIMGLRHLERVTIDVEPNGFTWRLIGDGGQEVVVSLGDADQLAGMLLATEVLLNTELGIRESRLMLPELN